MKLFKVSNSFRSDDGPISCLVVAGSADRALDLAKEAFIKEPEEELLKWSR